MIKEVGLALNEEAEIREEWDVGFININKDSKGEDFEVDGIGYT